MQQFSYPGAKVRLFLHMCKKKEKNRIFSVFFVKWSINLIKVTQHCFIGLIDKIAKYPSLSDFSSNLFAYLRKKLYLCSRNIK